MQLLHIATAFGMMDTPQRQHKMRPTVGSTDAVEGTTLLILSVFSKADIAVFGALQPSRIKSNGGSCELSMRTVARLLQQYQIQTKLSNT
jgi:hypothetical protein